MLRFKWAQDHRHIYLTVSVRGAKESNPSVDIKEDGEVDVKAVGANLALKLSSTLDCQHRNTNWLAKTNSIEITLRKSEKGFWPFLLQGGKRANKLPNMETDWDRWVDEDECEDDEGDTPAIEPQLPAVPLEPPESAASEHSPLVGNSDAEREVFQGLKMEEKMVLFATMWNVSSEKERETALHRLIDLIDGGNEEKKLNSAHIKGAAVLGDRDTSVYAAAISHLESWMDDFKKGSQDQKVAAFERCWGWCDEHEKRLTMAGLT